MRMSTRVLRALVMSACICCFGWTLATADNPAVQLALPGDAASVVDLEPAEEDSSSGGEPNGAQPRGVCGNLIYQCVRVGCNLSAITPVPATNPEHSMGDTVTLAGTEREICEISVEVDVNTIAPMNVTLTIWDACPAAVTGGLPGGGCGANPDADILAQQTIPFTPLTTFCENITFTFNPPVLVPNQITVMLTCDSDLLRISLNGNPVIGSSAASVVRCGSNTGNNGCARVFGGVTNNVPMEIQAVANLGLGQCCLPDGTCQSMTGSACAVAGGAYGGEGSDCAGGCAGACCLAAGNCQFVTSDVCDANGGTFFGPLVPCASVEPCLGACCAADVTCTDTTEVGCAPGGAGFLGYGLPCTLVNCALFPFCADGFTGSPTDFAGHGAGGIVATVSDLNPALDFRSADNFTPAADGQITAVTWWGYYRQTDPIANCPVQSGDTPDDFRIVLYENLLDVPAPDMAPIASFAVNPTKINTTVTVGGRLSHRYEAILPQPVVVSANRCYWIEIVNNTTGACHWLWQTAPGGDGLSATTTNASGPYLASDQNDFDYALCMDIETLADGCNSDVEVPRACCPPPGTGGCVNTAPSDCVNNLNGLIGGPGSVCTATSCDGACCVSDGQGGFNCSITPEDACNSAGGIWNGAFSTCDSLPCSGACCAFDGSCSDGVSLVSCSQQPPAGGMYTGGATCADVNCGATFICNATDLACGGSTTVDNTALATDPAPIVQPVTQSCFGGGANVGVGAFWVKFTGTGGPATVSLCNSNVIDTVLSVYSRADNDCNLITNTDEVGCSEDVAGCGTGLLSRVDLASTVAGQTYWALISSFDANSVGLIRVDVTCPPPCTTCLGDVSGDGQRNGVDVQAFINVLSSSNGCADYDQNGTVNELDVDGFVDDLVNATGACP